MYFMWMRIKMRFLFLCFAVAALALTCSAQSRPAAGAPKYSYGGDFLWGAATSAHQFEGILGGGQYGDWYVFEHSGNNIRDGSNGDVATNQWQLYPKDLGLAQSMGLNTVRISLAWEKIEPNSGVFSADAIAHYRAELQLFRSLGIRPMITLFHFAAPEWFDVNGGFLAQNSPQLFAAYATYVVQQLGDLCNLWATINEPSIFLATSYFQGAAPPQVHGLGNFSAAYNNLLQAHRLATTAIHTLQPPNTALPLNGVGLVNNLEVFEPYSSSLADAIATASVQGAYNWTFSQAAIKGGGSSVVDWMGINYYSHFLVKSNQGGPVQILNGAGPTGDNGWAIYPAGIEKVLRQAAARFPGIPLVVTENGVADASDQLRQQTISDTLHYLDLAKFGHDGLPPVDVRGYYHWALTDNFEWLNGYLYRFGLVNIDYSTLQRVPRPSAAVYTQEILARR